jgi:predicted phosphodiesterase
MIVQPISDLHLDCLNEMHLEQVMENTINPKADVIILAGDTCEHAEIQLLKDFVGQTSKPFYIVAGNHEYWGDVNCKEFIPWFKKQLEHFPHVKVLENDHVVIDDVVIFGGTLWTNLRNPINANMIRQYMRDFVRSPGLTTDFTNDKHEETVEYIRQCLHLEQWKDLKKIVVTHHGPSFKAVDDFYKFDTANCGYQSNLDYILEAEWAPEVWIHGHSHMKMDRRLGNTRVIRNPMGYKSYGEMTTGFDPKFLINTDDLTTVDKYHRSIIDIWNEFEDQFK